MPSKHRVKQIVPWPSVLSLKRGSGFKPFRCCSSPTSQLLESCQRGPAWRLSLLLQRCVIHEVEDLIRSREHASRKADQRSGAREVPKRNILYVAGGAAPVGRQRQHGGAAECGKAEHRQHERPWDERFEQQEGHCCRNRERRQGDDGVEGSPSGPIGTSGLPESHVGAPSMAMKQI